MRWTNAAAVAISLALATPVQAQQQDQPLSTVLNVNAMGVSTARPDMATVQLGVTTFAPTARAALAENAQRMTALIQTLRRQGVAERDIQTAYVRVSTRYRDRSYGVAPEILGYEATNSVRAQVRDVDDTGRIIDAVVEAGSNQIYGVSFGYSEPSSQLDLARRNAIEVARERANLYPGAIGMRVVRIISVTEQGAAAASLDDEIVVTARRREGDGYRTPIAAGELATQASVSVSFELR